MCFSCRVEYSHMKLYGNQSGDILDDGGSTKNNRAIFKWGAGVVLREAPLFQGDRVTFLNSENSAKKMLVVSVLIPPGDLAEMMKNSDCDVVLISGEIPWSSLSNEVQKLFFRTTNSPFKNGGYVSGKYVLPLIVEWVRQVKRGGFQKPIFVGGSVIRSRDALSLLEAGVSAFVLRDAIALRPWNVPFIIRRVKNITPGIRN